MLALIAVLLFGLALVMDLADFTFGDWGVMASIAAGLGFLAAHIAFGGGPWKFHR